MKKYEREGESGRETESEGGVEEKMNRKQGK